MNPVPTILPKYDVSFSDKWCAQEVCLPTYSAVARTEDDNSCLHGAPREEAAARLEGEPRFAHRHPSLSLNHGSKLPLRDVPGSKVKENNQNCTFWGQCNEQPDARPPPSQMPAAHSRPLAQGDKA